MLKDYTNMPRNDSHDRRGRGPKKHGLLVLLIVLVVGFGLYYVFSHDILVLNTHRNLPSPETTSSTSNSSANSSTTSEKATPSEKTATVIAEKAAPKKPRFEFYSLLSKETVPVPHQKNASADVTTTETESETTKPKPIDSEKTTESNVKPLPAPTGVPSIPVKTSGIAQAQTATSSMQTTASSTTTSSPASTTTAVSTTASEPTSSDTKPLVPVTTTQPSAATQNTGTYVLQVAALPRLGDADAMKAKLSFLGYNVILEPFLHNGITWYRVKVGPYSSLEAAEKAKTTLNNGHYSSMLIRL